MCEIPTRLTVAAKSADENAERIIILPRIFNRPVMA